MPDKLRSVRDMVLTLEAGTYSLSQLYDLAEERADTSRNGGHDPVPSHPTDRRWKHGLRGALQDLRRAGKAHRIGREAWAIRGTVARPERMVLIVAGATLAEFELRLQSATELLRTLDTPADLVLADPPWGLDRGTGRHYADGNGYRRDHSQIIDGYVDVPNSKYSDFTHRWIEAAASALRPGGQLTVVTGPQRAAIVQVAAEQADLTWVTSIAARKTFPLATLSRPACAHWTVTVMTRGPLHSKARVFNPPQDQPKARSGHLYPQDWWSEGNGRSDRPKLLRHDNALPLPLVLRLVRAFSNAGQYVVDPFLGSGTTAIACWLTGRLFTGGDVNPGSLRFTSARLLAEHSWQPAELEGAAS